jgi:hypothetical protein
MADWRQIQARIRKAKNAPDAHVKLSELFQRTRDAMVAWELALIEEKSEHIAEAGRWYTIAAQRFRRAEWKKKAEEALTRLGIALPAPGEEAAVEPHVEVREEGEKVSFPLALGEIPHIPATAAGGMNLGESHDESPAGSHAATETGDAGKKKRRRGRRGGRGRRRKGATSAPGLPSQAFAESSTAPREHQPRPHVVRVEPPVRTPSPAYVPPEAPRRVHVEPPEPTLPSERTAHGRAGDPALASRLVHLESMLRRLVSSPLHRMEEAEEAPAGPGVFLLSDSDQISSYYVEACQTLRVGIGNLVRGARGSGGSKGSRGGRGGGYASDSGLKAKLAEHLEISEAKVGQYLKDHCVVRWIQLDDEAPLLAHFAVAVLRTPLNMD